MKAEALLGPLVDRGPDDVRRQQVAGELDAGVVKPEQACQQVSQGRLAHAREVLDQQMPAREQAGERHTQRVLLTEDDAAGAVESGRELVGGYGVSGQRHDVLLPDRARSAKNLLSQRLAVLRLG